MEDPTKDTLLSPEVRAEIMTEYNTLRAEMLHRLEMRQQLLTFTLICVGTLVSVGLEKATILLVYPVLAMFLALVWVQHDTRIGEIGEYIRLNIETKMAGLQWDTSLHQKYQGSSLRLVEIYAYGLFSVIPLLTVLLALPGFSYSPAQITLLAGDLVAVVISTLVLRRRRAIYRPRVGA
jgi:hypothetical protein